MTFLLIYNSNEISIAVGSKTEVKNTHLESFPIQLHFMGLLFWNYIYVNKS